MAGHTPASDGVPGPGREQHPVERGGVRGGHGVVAPDVALGAELGEVADDRADEAVVVVDDEDPGRGRGHLPIVARPAGLRPGGAQGVALPEGFADAATDGSADAVPVAGADDVALSSTPSEPSSGTTGRAYSSDVDPSNAGKVCSPRSSTR